MDWTDTHDDTGWN